MTKNEHKAKLIQVALKAKGWIARAAIRDTLSLRSVIFEELEKADKSQPELFFTLNPAAKQITLMALSELSIARPLFRKSIEEIATTLDGKAEFERLRLDSANRVKLRK